MIIPIRCFTCGKVIGNRWELFKELTSNGWTNGQAMDAVGCDAYCCRRMILGHIDLVDRLVK